jgi:type VI secretion system protein ImpF
MADLTPQERLQPALLDRLTDNEPDKTQETREQRVMSRSRLQQAALRDLAWLFNSTRLEGDTDFSKAPFARRSVVNFGLPAFSGRSAAAIEVTELERAIKQSVLDYEPRILPASLRVRAVTRPDRMDHYNVIGVQIQGQLWAQPVPLELLVRTEIDLETGKVEIAELTPARST